MEHRALALAKRGDVLVIATEGPTGGTWGQVFATMAIRIGLAGVVSDGFVRDVRFLRSTHFPTFARGISPQGSTKSQPGSVNTPVNCGGVDVNPGDIIIGDEDGVVVVPKDRAGWALKASLERAAREKSFFKSIKAGKDTFELLGLADVYSKLDVEEVDSKG